jgi:uncharacterized protein YebE (UPF0316 family)
MYNIPFLNSELFAWVILPILIFAARVIDVTFGTIRIIFISKGEKFLAPLFGFFEIIVWLFAIGQIMQNLTNLTYYFAYAVGFATGNFVGMYIEEKMAMGTLVIRIITNKDASNLIEAIKLKNYGLTVVDAQGATGDVKIIFTVIKRKNVGDVVEMIKQFNPKAFFSIEEVRLAKEGIFPTANNKFGLFGSFRFNRTGK